MGINQREVNAMVADEEHPTGTPWGKRLVGKNTLVTGAGSGIGRAIATRYALEGANVCIVDKNDEGARETERLLQQCDVRTAIIITDVTDGDQVKAMVDEYYRSFDRIDVLVNNAGVGGAMSRVVSFPEEKWDAIMAINLRSVFLVSKYAGKKMIKQDAPDDTLRGKIINISSTRGKGGRPLFAAYGASKAGVLNFTQTLALELASYRITVNAICPGVTQTAIWGNLKPEELAGMAATPIPLCKIKPVGQPDDIAKVAFFLASSDSDWMTGQSVIVSGGMIMD